MSDNDGSGGNAGFVGINTTTPDTMLHLRGASGFYPSIHGQYGSDTLFRLEQYFANEGFLGLYLADVRTVQFRGGNTQSGAAPCYINTGAGNNFGVGTATPGAKLTVQGASTETAAPVGYFYTNAIHTGVDYNSIVSIRSDHASSTGKVLHVRGDGSGNLLTLDQGGTDRLVVQADGNVGIGTTAPAATLEVRNTSTAASKWTAAFCSDNQAAQAAQAHDNVLIQATDVPCLKILETANPNQVATLAVGDGNATLASSNTLRFFVSGSVTGDGYNGLGGTQAMHIKTDGKVGIGTNNPANLLTLRQAAGANIRFENATTGRYFIIGEGVGGNDRFSFRGNSYRSTDTLTVDFTNDRVGVGTINPAAKLEVQGVNRSTAFSASNGATWHDTIIKNPNGTAGSACGIVLQTSGYHSNAGTGIAAIDAGGDFSAHLAFITRPDSAVAQERMRITDTGNVGIGTTNPGTWKLRVEGAGFFNGSVLIPNASNYFGALNSSGTPKSLIHMTSSNEVIINSAHGSAQPTKIKGKYITFETPDSVLGVDIEVMRVFQGSGFMAAGCVGIGVTTPSSKLDVNGTITGTSKNFNIPHPDPSKINARLIHASIEAPSNDTLYKFEVVISLDNETVTHPLPSYFKYLNKNPRMWIQARDMFSHAYGSFTEDLSSFSITGEKAGSYDVLIIATRKDEGVEGFVVEIDA